MSKRRPGKYKIIERKFNALLVEAARTGKDGSYAGLAQAMGLDRQRGTNLSERVRNKNNFTNRSIGRIQAGMSILTGRDIQLNEFVRTADLPPSLRKQVCDISPAVDGATQ